MEIIFNRCCDICIICASILNITYGQFCMLAFCYIQPTVMLLCGVLNYKHIIGKITIISMSFYLLFYLSRYSISNESFLKIYKDLHDWAHFIGISYIQINFLLYIIVPLIIVTVNIYNKILK